MAEVLLWTCKTTESLCLFYDSVSWKITTNYLKAFTCSNVFPIYYPLETSERLTKAVLFVCFFMYICKYVCNYFKFKATRFLNDSKCFTIKKEKQIIQNKFWTDNITNKKKGQPSYPQACEKNHVFNDFLNVIRMGALLIFAVIYTFSGSCLIDRKTRVHPHQIGRNNWWETVLQLARLFAMKSFIGDNQTLNCT